MEELEDDIGLLFKNAFDGHKASPGDTSWEALNHSLGTRNFYRFNPYQFNIYYASSIIACLFICLGVGSHYTYKQWIEDRQPVVSVAPATVPTGVGLASEELEVPAKPQSDQKVETATEKKAFVKESSQAGKGVTENPEKERAVNYAPIKTDSSHHVAAKNPAPLHHTSQVKADSSTKPKRTLYITKRDTIFKVDTIKTHKKQKKWF